MKINPQLAPHLVSLILRMTEKSTQKRYSNWADILSALSLETVPTDVMSSIVELATQKRTEADLNYQNQLSEGTMLK